MIKLNFQWNVKIREYTHHKYPPLPLCSAWPPPQVVDLSRGTLTQDMRPNRLSVMIKTCETFIRGGTGRKGGSESWGQRSLFTFH